MTYKRFEIVLITIVSLLLSYQIIRYGIDSFESSEEDLIIGSINIIVIFISKFFLFSIGLYSLIQLIKKRRFAYVFSVLIVLFTFIGVFVLNQKIEKRDNSPVVLNARYDGLRLILRANKTYKIQYYSIFGGSNYFGEYRIKNDTIILSKKYPLGIQRKFMGNKLLINNKFVLIDLDSSGLFTEWSQLKIE